MNLHLTRFASSSLFLLATVVGAQSAGAAMLSRTDYIASKSRISASYKADKAACASLAGNARDICREEASAKEKVALAENEFSYTGTRKDQDKITMAKADTVYAVAKERCDDLAGNGKGVCRAEAKAVHTKALADLKLVQKTGVARADAMTDKRDADYKVAAEKCDALAGDAKAACISSAKVQAGKT